MGKRYIVVLGVVGLALAGYSLWWFDKADGLTYGVGSNLLRAMPENVELKFTVGEISGFPFRFVADVEDLELIIGGADRFSTSLVQAVKQPFNEGHVILRFPNGIDYAIQGGGSGTLFANRALASLTGLNDFDPKVDVDAREIEINSDTGDLLTVERAGLHLRHDSIGNHFAYDFSIAVAGLRRGGPETEGATAHIDGRVEHTKIETGAYAEIGYVPRQLTKVDVARYEFQAGNFGLDQSYTLDLSDLMAPTMAMQIEVAGGDAMLAAMRRENVLNSATLADVLAQHGQANGKGIAMQVDYADDVITVNGTALPESETDAFLSLF